MVKIYGGMGDDQWTKLFRARDELEKEGRAITSAALSERTGISYKVIRSLRRRYPAKVHLLRLVRGKSPGRRPKSEGNMRPPSS